MRYNEVLHEIGAGLQNPPCKSIVPGARLAEFVHRYFVLQGNNAAGSTYILPDNSAHLIFYLFDRGKTIVPACALVGPRSSHTIINRRDRPFTFICTFKPGALRPLINIPVSELKDLSPDAGDVLRNYHSSIFERLTHHASRFDLKGFVVELEKFLNSSVGATHPVIQGFYHRLSGEGRAVSSISKELGYSDRQLRNLIQNHIGHSPKTVQQIERFSASLRLRKFNDNWASIAHASGYYDQSHMIGDYQRLVGMTPERLFC
jgi:AraC-like DNA-binding protein